MIPGHCAHWIVKPDVTTAMLQLIAQVRKSFPFGQAEAQICAGPCHGCSLKLLGFLESELDGWEARIADGDQPGLAELSQLIRTSRKVGRALEKSRLIQGLMQPTPNSWLPCCSEAHITWCPQTAQ